MFICVLLCKLLKKKQFGLKFFFLILELSSIIKISIYISFVAISLGKDKLKAADVFCYCNLACQWWLRNWECGNE